MGQCPAEMLLRLSSVAVGGSPPRSTWQEPSQKSSGDRWTSFPSEHFLCFRHPGPVRNDAKVTEADRGEPASAFYTRPGQHPRGQ